MIHPGAVVYAKNLDKVGAFYAAVTGFVVTHSAADHMTLAGESFQLVIVAIPASIAAGIEIADPPVRREDTAIKLMFAVPSLSAARKVVAAHGGELNPIEWEWQSEGVRVCDGHDPEGNVIQLRERV
jgi:predicted enzyme related to lactoylglutathione lyase